MPSSGCRRVRVKVCFSFYLIFISRKESLHDGHYGAPAA